MGTFLCPGKDGNYWALIQNLYGKKVFTQDQTLIPYMPTGRLDYVDFYPELYTPGPFTILSIYINGQIVGQGHLSSSNGLFYVPIKTPWKKFVLQVVDAHGNILKTEYYTAKNQAFLLSVQAQSYAWRNVQLEYVKRDLDFSTISSQQIYPQVGVFFDFLPPAGWTFQMYRNAVLGDGGAHPGFVNSFLDGGSQKGFINTIRSITGSTVTLTSVFDGKRWLLYDKAHAPNPTTPGSNSWYLGPINPPGNQIMLLSKAFKARAIKAVVSGASRTITNENVLKNSNSFIQAGFQGPYNGLPGTTLSFSINGTSYAVTFGPSTTTAAQAAADILAQNPSLTSSIYASNGYLRIGTAPVSQQEIPITINSGTSLPILGFEDGQFIEVATDIMANPNQTTPTTITWNSLTFVQGTDYTINTVTGEIVWSPSLSTNTLPPAGSVFQVSYTYLMKREIEKMANMAKDPSIFVYYDYN